MSKEHAPASDTTTDSSTEILQEIGELASDFRRHPEKYDVPYISIANPLLEKLKLGPAFYPLEWDDCDNK